MATTTTPTSSGRGKSQKGEQGRRNEEEEWFSAATSTTPGRRTTTCRHGTNHSEGKQRSCDEEDKSFAGGYRQNSPNTSWSQSRAKTGCISKTGKVPK
jgi:hypothetical protein